MPEKTMGDGWTPVCPESGVANDQFQEFQLDGEPCFLFRRRGRLFAYRNRCPHLGIPLNWMPERFLDPDNCFIHCVNHGALFTPESGDCIAGPCQGDRLMSVPLRIADGTIEARL
ncbi:Rieske (2Fe-2S) protein [Marinobacter sp. M1N3S26]|uniref:Rieske (2Fe-2S) protein n=1 Tax=Marinobacter sp. M1N3S26 TaxID=3382299 RepID=UPI00387ADC47